MGTNIHLVDRCDEITTVCRFQPDWSKGISAIGKTGLAASVCPVYRILN
jgi:hypothetical protein